MEYIIETNTNNQAKANVLKGRCKAWLQANENKVKEGVHIVPTDNEALKLLVTLSEKRPNKIKCKASFIKAPFTDVKYKFWWERITSPSGWDKQLRREIFKTEWKIK